MRSTGRRRFLGLLAALIASLACNLPALRRAPPTPTAAPEPGGSTPNPPAPPLTAAATDSPPADAPTPAAETAAPELTLPPGFVIDGHEDIAWNWLEFGRDPAHDALVARAAEAGTLAEQTVGARITGLPQWIAGRVGVIFASLFVMPQRRAWGDWMTQTYATPEGAYSRAQAQLDAYHELAAREPQITLIQTVGDLEDVLLSWATPGADPVVGLVLLMEGADPIRQPAEVNEWAARGLRIIGPAWAATRYAGGTGEPGSLTSVGRELLDAMAAAGMILDLSHLAEEAALEAVDSYPGVVIAGHANPRAFLPSDRGLSDDLIRRLAARGGVIGVMPYNAYLVPGWQTGDSRAGITADTVAGVVDAIAQITGSIAHAGIGSDFDGGFGVESIPSGMETVADLAQIGEALAARGYSDEDIAAVLHGNWLRVLRSALPWAGFSSRVSAVT